MKIEFARSFKKQYDKAPEKIKNSFNKKLIIFERNKFDNHLDNHKLKGKLIGLRSISITGDWRAVFLEKENETIVFFIMLGTHSQIYK
jgi:addiction module RelE/StbE family toxin